MKILEQISDLIVHYALKRNELESFLTHHSDDIIDNLIIILRYEDPDYIHHLTELNAPIKKLARKTITIKPKFDDCYKWLFGEIFPDFKTFDSHINSFITPFYTKLSIIRSNLELYQTIQKCIKLIVRDFVSKRLDNAWYYIPNDDINFKKNKIKLQSLGYDDKLTRY